MQIENLDHNKLAALGLQVWQPRPFRHPQLTQQATLFDAPEVRINARCLVVSYAAQLTPTQLNAAEQKIFSGMLSVLGLSSAEIMQVTVYSLAPELELITQHLAQYKAATILQLSMQLPALPLASLVQTYSPQFLAQNPQYKSQAYQALLALRKILDASAIT